MPVHRLGEQSFKRVTDIEFTGNGNHLVNGNSSVVINTSGYVDFQWAGSLDFRVVMNGNYMQAVGGSSFTVRGNVAAGDSDADFAVEPVVVRNNDDYLQSWKNNSSVKAAVRADGRIVMGAPDSAIADGDLAASQLSFYWDEAGNQIVVKAKEADGSTVKTGNIAVS